MLALRTVTNAPYREQVPGPQGAPLYRSPIPKRFRLQGRGLGMRGQAYLVGVFFAVVSAFIGWNGHGHAAPTGLGVAGGLMWGIPFAFALFRHAAASVDAIACDEQVHIGREVFEWRQLFAVRLDHSKYSHLTLSFLVDGRRRVACISFEPRFLDKGHRRNAEQAASDLRVQRVAHAGREGLPTTAPPGWTLSETARALLPFFALTPIGVAVGGFAAASIALVATLFVAVVVVVQAAHGGGLARLFKARAPADAAEWYAQPAGAVEERRPRA